jgi:hypothetical protein
MTIILDEDSLDSDTPDPQILKRSKMLVADRAEVGWESPEDWEFDNKTLASKIAKLKKKQDGEVDNPPAAQGSGGDIECVQGQALDGGGLANCWDTFKCEGKMHGGRANLAEGCEACSCEIRYDPPLPSPTLFDFLAFPSTPNSHFLGVAADCGIQLGSASAPASPLLDVIRAKELVQAKLAEALEKATALELARKAAEVLDKQTDAGAPSTSAVEAPTTSPQA